MGRGVGVGFPHHVIMSLGEHHALNQQDLEQCLTSKLIDASMPFQLVSTRTEQTVHKRQNGQHSCIILDLREGH